MTSTAINCYPNSASGFVSFSQFKQFVLNYIELIVLALLALSYLTYIEHEKTLKQAVYDKPQKSDFFYVDYLAIDPSSDRKFRYIPMKVLAVNEEGIRFKVGNIAHTTPVSPRHHAKLDKAVLARNYYKTNDLVLSHENVDALIESGAIYNARRPNNVYIGGWIVIQPHEIVVEDE